MRNNFLTGFIGLLVGAGFILTQNDNQLLQGTTVEYEKVDDSTMRITTIQVTVQEESIAATKDRIRRLDEQLVLEAQKPNGNPVIMSSLKDIYQARLLEAQRIGIDINKDEIPN